MSQETENQEQVVDLETLSTELQQVIKFDDVPKEMFAMVASIHEVSEEAVRESWDALPASAQNILDNFEQFHALVSVSQAFAGVSVMEEFETKGKPDHISEEEYQDYRAKTLDKVLYDCVKDMSKQLKKARREPLLKKDFTDVFSK